MQTSFQNDCSYEEYHSNKLWRQASLKKCPVHSDGQCRLERHGTYERYAPDGQNKTRIARFICRRDEGTVTISLLPQFFAAQHPGTLQEFEDQVEAAEKLGAGKAAEQFRSSPPNGQRQSDWWLRRRMKRLHRTLAVAKERLIEMFQGCEATVTAMRRALGKNDLLLYWRRQLHGSLKDLGSPIGFAAVGQGRFHPSNPTEQA